MHDHAHGPVTGCEEKISAPPPGHGRATARQVWLISLHLLLRLIETVLNYQNKLLCLSLSKKKRTLRPGGLIGALRRMYVIGANQAIAVNVPITPGAEISTWQPLNLAQICPTTYSI